MRAVMIDGVVASDVAAGHSVVIPAGSPVRGRIRRTERNTDPSYFVVGLEFTSAEVRGVPHMFYADIVEMDPVPGVELILSTKNTTTTMTNPLLFGSISTRQSIESLFLYNLPGVVAFFFFFYKGPRLDLPRDFRTFRGRFLCLRERRWWDA